MGVFLFLYGVALALRRRYHLGRELFGHRLLVSLARVENEPAHGERGAAIGSDFDWNLVSSTTDAAALHFDYRLQVRERLLEHVDAGLARTRFHEVHGAVENPLGHRLLPLIHEGIDELRDGLAIVA